MTIVEKYMKEHSGLQWHNAMRIPFLFFAAFELLVLLIVFTIPDNKLRQLLIDVKAYSHWQIAILIGSFGGILGILTRGINSFGKYHVTSTSQFINSLAWGASAFILLSTTDENALAFGLFALSIINVVLAVLDEGWGDRKINTA